MASKAERNTKTPDEAGTLAFSWDTDGTQYLYFVRIPDGPVKIGRAMDVEKRVKTLQCASPWKLELLGAQRDKGGTESNWHMAFYRQRMEGEWFAWSDDLAAAIDRAVSDPTWTPCYRSALDELVRAINAEAA